MYSPYLWQDCFLIKLVSTFFHTHSSLQKEELQVMVSQREACMKRKDLHG